MTINLDALRAEVRALRASVGNPGAVVGKDGRLPADRRELSLLYFRLWREDEVKKSRSRCDELEEERAQTEPRSPQRKAVEQELLSARRRLDQLLDVPPQEVDDMCSEYPHPLSWHRWSVHGGELSDFGPCPAFPRWADKLRRIREEFFSRPAAPPGPAEQTPRPLAVIPSGLSIAEVMRRLADAKAKWPDAEVRRGARNRWELWPPK